MIFQCRGVYEIYKYDIYVLLVISCLMRSQSSSGSKSFSTQFALVGWWLRLNRLILHVRAKHISNMTTLIPVRPRPCLSTQLNWMLLSSLYSWMGLNWLWGFMIDSLYNCSKIWRKVIHNIVINNFFSYVSNYVLLLNFLTFHKYQELKRIII